MCYAIPGQVVAIDGTKVTVAYYGEHKTAWNELKKLTIGDYVYAQGGYIIEKIPTQEALDILDAWKETFFLLQETDQQLTKIPKDPNVNPAVRRILDKAAESRQLSRTELSVLMDLTEPAELELLYKTANFLRHKHLGNSCCVHGILEFANYCTQACQYCGISIDMTVQRYRLSADQLVAAALQAIREYGFKALVLQSGEDAYPVEELAQIIERIKQEAAVLIFVSVGEVGVAGLQRLYQAGARGVLMRFETSNEVLYATIRPGRKLSDRITLLKAAYEMGFLVITGGLIGIPGQTTDDILNDILLTKELNAEMFSFGPFLPVPGTVLEKATKPDPALVMKTLAISRLVDPSNAKILVTTGFETLHPLAREQGLMAGANSVMLNVTPLPYREYYSIYPNRAHIYEPLSGQITTTLALLKKLGRAPTDLGVN
jgi:biotin synthase